MSAATKLPLSVFMNWLAFGERGLSSEAIVSHLTGEPVGRYSRHHPDHPYDPDDFRRCQRLLNEVPLARLVFDQMRTASSTWARLVDAWDEIHETILAEAPEYMDRKGSAPTAYRLMRRIRDDGVKCEPCDGTGRAEPCEKCKGTGKRSGGRCRAEKCGRGYHPCSACRGEGYTKRITA